MEKKLIAPCGLDCFKCDFHENNITEEIIQSIHEKWGVAKDEVECKGCRQQEGKHFCEDNC